MKILSLKFKNLASLAGIWSIDFTDPELSKDGIFAIIGRTASGKTTIFDAICLALYRRTPRLSSPVTQILTLGETECFSEVKIEVSDKKYLCHWSKNNSAEHHVIYELDSHNDSNMIQLNDKNRLTDAAKLITNKIIGLTPDQFWQAAMLSQGEFTKFLELNETHRADLLEKLTGTSIYNEIADKAQTHHSDAIKKLAEVENQRTGLLSSVANQNEEELKQSFALAEEKINILAKQEKDLRNISSNTETLISKNQEINNNKIKLSEQKDELQKLEHNLSDAIQETDNAEKELEQLNNQTNEQIETIKEVVIPLDKEIISLDTILKSNKDESKKEFDAWQNARKDYKNKFDQKKEDEIKLSKSKEYLDNNAADAAIKDSLSGFSVKSDTIIKTINDAKNKENELAYLKKIIKDNTNIASDYKNKLADLKEKISQIDSDLNKIDPILQEELSKFDGRDRTELISSLLIESNNCKDALKNCNDWQKRSDILQSNLDKKNNALANVKEIKEQKEKQSDICASLEKLKELKQTTLETQNKLDALIDILEEGKACPLCGSEQHPHPYKKSSEALKLSAEIEEIASKKVEADKIFKELEQSHKNAEKEAEKFENSANSDQEILEQIHSKLSDWEEKLTLPAIGAENSALWASRLQEEKTKLQIYLDSLNTANSKIKELETKQAALNKEKSEIENTKNGLDVKLAKIEATILANNTNAETCSIEINAKKASINKEWQELAHAFKELNCNLPNTPNVQELKAAIETLTKRKVQYETNSIEFDTLNKNIEHISFELTNLEKEGNNAKTNYKEYEKKAEEIEQQLANKKAKRNAVLSEPDSQAAIEKLRKALDTKKEELSKKKQELSKMQSKKHNLEETCGKYEEDINSKDKFIKELKAAIKNAIEQFGFADNNLDSPEAIIQIITAQLEEIENNKNSLNEEKGSIAQKLQVYDNSKELEEIIEKAKQEEKHWEKMENYLKPKKSTTLNKFAQGITFELLLMAANKHLQQFNDRYTLQSSENIPMLFDIIDNMQSNAKRPPSNLSGGEKFLVSLSLALGLSDMASENIAIDTLFIDEGFGTLSEDYLITVLDALAKLKNHSKTIGVISHVEQLKTVIKQHISLEKIGGGLSEIITSGPNASPGCRKLS